MINTLEQAPSTASCADPESFARGDPTFFDNGKEDPNSTKSRPSTARQRIAI